MPGLSQRFQLYGRLPAADFPLLIPPMENRLPMVAIVGRVNVGKSTLFNRLIGKPLAVVDRRPGVTRDRIQKPVTRGDIPFLLLDTGGLYPPEEDAVWPVVRRHIEQAVREADLVLFLVDLKTGLTPYDREIADWLRKLGKEVILVANKADVKRKDPLEFLALGFGEPILISAEHNRGIEALLERIEAHLRARGYEPKRVSPRTEKIRVAIVGKPNVGKSSLLNALAGRELAITSPVPGTTRDAIDVEVDRFIFVDTAGVRRRFTDELEYYAYLRTERSLSYAEVAIVVMDVTTPITRMDKRLVGMVEEEGRAMVIALNKADLLPPKKRKEYFPYVKQELHFADYAPKLFTSAVTGEGLDYLKDLLVTVRLEWVKQLSREQTLEVLEEALKRYQSPVEITGFSQVGTKPPTFRIRARGTLPSSYVKFLERVLREKHGFIGVPIRMEVRVIRKRGRP